LRINGINKSLRLASSMIGRLCAQSLLFDWDREVSNINTLPHLREALCSGGNLSYQLSLLTRRLRMPLHTNNKAFCYIIAAACNHLPKLELLGDKVSMVNKNKSDSVDHVECLKITQTRIQQVVLSSNKSMSGLILLPMWPSH